MSMDPNTTSPQFPTPDPNLEGNNSPQKEIKSKPGSKITLSKFNKKIIATVFGFLLLITSVGIGVYLTQKEQRTKVGAAGVSLTLSSTNSTPKVGDNFVVAANMNPGGLAVNGIDLRITFDPNLLTATSITPGNLLTNVLIQGSIDNTAGTAMIVVGAPIDASGPHPVSTSGLVAQIGFKAKNADSPTLIGFGNLTVVSVANQTQNALGSTASVQITVVSAGTPTPSKTPTPTPTKTPSPTPTRTPTPTPTRSPTPTPTGTPTPTPSKTPTPSPTRTPSPTPTLSVIPGDINRDGHVTIVDVGILVDNYNLSPIPDPRADINGDGQVSIVDVGILVDNYGR